MLFRSRAVSFQRPAFHFAETLTTELRLAAQWLLRDQAVRPGGTCVHLVVDQVVQLQHVHVANRDRTLKGIGQRIGNMLQEHAKVAELRKFLDELYNKSGGKTERLEHLSDAEIMEMSANLTNGVPFATPVFDGAAEEEIRGMLKLA